MAPTYPPSKPSRSLLRYSRGSSDDEIDSPTAAHDHRASFSAPLVLTSGVRTPFRRPQTRRTQLPTPISAQVTAPITPGTTSAYHNRARQCSPVPEPAPEPQSESESELVIATRSPKPRRAKSKRVRQESPEASSPTAASPEPQRRRQSKRQRTAEASYAEVAQEQGQPIGTPDNEGDNDWTPEAYDGEMPGAAEDADALGLFAVEAVRQDDDDDNDDDDRSPSPVGRRQSDNRQAGTRTPGTHTTFDEFVEALNMRPSPRHVIGEISERDHDSGIKIIRNVVAAAKFEAGKPITTISLKDRALAPSLNTILYHDKRNMIVEQVVNGLTPRTAEILGRRTIGKDDLLSLPCHPESYEWLQDRWGVYINIVEEEDGSISIYVGSGTSKDRIFSRLLYYANIRLDRTKPHKKEKNGRHIVALKPDSGRRSNVRLLWTGPKTVSTATALFVEGLMTVLFGSASNDSVSQAHRCPPAIKDFSHANRLQVLIQVGQLNVLCSLKQGYARRSNVAADNQCTQCSKVFGPKARRVLCYGQQGMARMCETCFDRIRKQEQFRLNPDACGRCIHRGKALTCDGQTPCSNCREKSVMKGCHYSREAHHPSNGGHQAKEDKCTNCAKDGRYCEPQGEGMPCVRCSIMGVCSFTGEAPRVIQPTGDKCFHCYRDGARCDQDWDNAESDGKGAVTPRCKRCASRKTRCRRPTPEELAIGPHHLQESGKDRRREKAVKAGSKRNAAFSAAVKEVSRREKDKARAQ